MNVNDLRNYRKWIGVSAQQIYLSVLAAGGWKNVFPTNLPRWASKVRNYFNVVPTTLEQVPEDVARRALKQVQRFAFLLECHETQTFNKYHRNYRPNARGELDPPPFRVPANCPAKASSEVVHTGMVGSIATKNALAGVVYQDETKRLWYQMAAGSTIYHYGRTPRVPTAEAIYVDKIKGQNDTPVFKLISPDNTGGSLEFILKNSGAETVGPVKQQVNITKRVVCDPAYQGSYNYSETAQVGIGAHQLRDVRTHVAGKFFYVNPANPFAVLQSRRFPEKDLQGKTLADQK
jgi:hypothetical protein